jgi:hypothetical protein
MGNLWGIPGMAGYGHPRDGMGWDMGPTVWVGYGNPGNWRDMGRDETGGLSRKARAIRVTGTIEMRMVLLRGHSHGHSLRGHSHGHGGACAKAGSPREREPGLRDVQAG